MMRNISMLFKGTMISMPINGWLQIISKNERLPMLLGMQHIELFVICIIIEGHRLWVLKYNHPIIMPTGNALIIWVKFKCMMLKVIADTLIAHHGLLFHLSNSFRNTPLKRNSSAIGWITPIVNIQRKFSCITLSSSC